MSLFFQKYLKEMFYFKKQTHLCSIFFLHFPTIILCLFCLLLSIFYSEPEWSTKKYAVHGQQNLFGEESGRHWYDWYDFCDWVIFKFFFPLSWASCQKVAAGSSTIISYRKKYILSLYEIWGCLLDEKWKQWHEVIFKHQCTLHFKMLNMGKNTNGGELKLLKSGSGMT